MLTIVMNKNITMVIERIVDTKKDKNDTKDKKDTKNDVVNTSISPIYNIVKTLSKQDEKTLIEKNESRIEAILDQILENDKNILDLIDLI